MRIGARPPTCEAMILTRCAPLQAASDVAASSPKPDEIQLGLVFHFVKVRNGEAVPGVPFTGGAGTTADPQANAGGFRYGTFYGRQRTACLTLARVLHRWPNTLHIVRGLDVCADEDEVVDEVAVTVVHEVAHHFGIDEETLHRLGWG